MAATAPFFVQTFHYPDGKPLSGGKLYFYVAGSTTLPKQVFADPGLTIPISQPIVLDPSGTSQQYFMEPGLYKIALYAPTNVLVATRDYVEAIGDSGDDTDSYHVKTTSGDMVPGFLSEKVLHSATVLWSSVNDGGSIKLQAEVDADNVLDGRIKARSSDPALGFLNEKIESTETVVLEVVGNKLQARSIAPNIVGVTSSDADPDFLGDKLEDTDSVHWSITGYTGGGQHLRAEVQPGAGDTYQAKVNSSDTVPGFLDTKIKAGSGVVITETTDAEGVKMHIATTGNTNGKVKTSSTDSVLSYLKDKISAGDNITIVEENGVAGKTLRINAVPATALGYEQQSRSYDERVRYTDSNVHNLFVLTLSAGTWDVCAGVNAHIAPTGGLNTPGFVANISSSSATIAEDGWDQRQALRVNTADDTVSASVPMKRFVCTATTAIYLCVQARYGTFSYADFYGNITARQVV